MKTKNNYGLVLLAAVFALVAIVAGSTYASSRLPKEKQVKVENKQKNKEKGFDIEQLYQNETHIFLSKDFSDKKIEAAKNDMDLLSTEEKELVTIADKKWEIQKCLNQFYASPVLVGDTINGEAVYRQPVTRDQQVHLDQLIAYSGLNDAFIETARNLAAGSALIIVANEKLAIIVKNDEIIPTFTIEQYLEAKDAINRVTNEQEQQKLQKKIEIVENELNAMGIDF